MRNSCTTIFPNTFTIHQASWSMSFSQDARVPLPMTNYEPLDDKTKFTSDLRINIELITHIDEFSMFFFTKGLFAEFCFIRFNFPNK